MGTIRIIFISKGFKYLAPIVGFFEILVWLLAIGQLFRNSSNAVYYLAYAGGFAMGTFVGIYLENKLSIGTQIVRIITRKGASRLLGALRSQGFGVTNTDAEGKDGPVSIIYSVIDRRDLQKVVGIIERHNPHAFYSVEDVRFVSGTTSRRRAPWYRRRPLGLFRRGRKGK
jgi:uncharacterized protein YebE (UPF0316 family)